MQYHFEPLLTALGEARTQRITPDPDWAARARADMAVLMDTYVPPVDPVSSRWQLFLLTRLGWAGVTAGLLFFAIGGSVLAAQGAMPGTALYPVKRAVEEFATVAAPTPRAKVQLHLQFAERRVQEITAIDTASTSEPELRSLIEDFEAHLAHASAVTPSLTSPVAARDTETMIAALAMNGDAAIRSAPVVQNGAYAAIAPSLRGAVESQWAVQEASHADTIPPLHEETRALALAIGSDAGVPLQSNDSFLLNEEGATIPVSSDVMHKTTQEERAVAVPEGDHQASDALLSTVRSEETSVEDANDAPSSHLGRTTLLRPSSDRASLITSEDAASSGDDGSTDQAYEPYTVPQGVINEITTDGDTVVTEQSTVTSDYSVTQTKTSSRTSLGESQSDTETISFTTETATSSATTTPDDAATSTPPSTYLIPTPPPPPTPTLPASFTPPADEPDPTSFSPFIDFENGNGDHASPTAVAPLMEGTGVPLDLFQPRNDLWQLLPF